MKIKTMTQSALLLGIGLVLHMIIPSFMGFMKPDFMLVMMFICIFKSTSHQEDFVISFIAGLLSGLTSAMPFGLIANLIDKIFIGMVISFLKGVTHRKISLTFIGTILSGLIFLSVIVVLSNLEFKMLKTLFIVHVLPTALLNALLVNVLTKKISL